MWQLLVAIHLAAATPAETRPAADLKTPVRIEAAGETIDVDFGHAAPWFADFDGDGRPDLLVGQFGDGKLRIYPNQADGKVTPKLAPFKWFEAGGAEGTIPAG